MHKAKGKLLAVLTGVLVLLVAVAAALLFWKDIYCHLFLDPRLVGRWEGTEVGLLEFDRIGNVHATSEQQPVHTGTYRIDANSLTIAWSDETNPNELTYRLQGDSLIVERGGRRSTLRRMPDDP